MSTIAIITVIFVITSLGMFISAINTEVTNDPAQDNS